MTTKYSTQLTAERLREILHYCPDTGVFTWIACAANRIKVGDIAGHKNIRGYYIIAIGPKAYKAHRLAWFYIYGTWPKDQIDHINEIKDDNRLCNLREADNSQNQRNQSKAYKCNASGFLGVSWHKIRKKFQANIRVDGKQCYLGLFETPESAHAAYLSAKAKFHKFSSHLTNPQSQLLPNEAKHS